MLLQLFQLFPLLDASSASPSASNLHYTMLDVLLMVVQDKPSSFLEDCTMFTLLLLAVRGNIHCTTLVLMSMMLRGNIHYATLVLLSKMVRDKLFSFLADVTWYSKSFCDSARQVSVFAQDDFLPLLSSMPPRSSLAGKGTTFFPFANVVSTSFGPTKCYSDSCAPYPAIFHLAAGSLKHSGKPRPISSLCDTIWNGAVTL